MSLLNDCYISENCKCKITVEQIHTERIAIIEYGELICPFCDQNIHNENDKCKVGDKCWKCNSEIIKIES